MLVKIYGMFCLKTCVPTWLNDALCGKTDFEKSAKYEQKSNLSFFSIYSS